MPDGIAVTATGGRTFDVEVGGQHFEVTVSAADALELGRGDIATLVRDSFAFLLEREDVSEILARFDLSVIESYFPEWRPTMRARD